MFSKNVVFPSFIGSRSRSTYRTHLLYVSWYKITRIVGRSGFLALEQFIWRFLTWRVDGKWRPCWKKPVNLLVMSNLSDSLTVALICPERPARFAHSRSFVLSDLSELLTVAQLIWAKWANERWANEQIPSPANNKYKFKPKISQNYDETLPFLVQYYIKHFKAFKTSCICL